jgi:hypothetical protein
MDLVDAQQTCARRQRDDHAAVYEIATKISALAGVSVHRGN